MEKKIAAKSYTGFIKTEDGSAESPTQSLAKSLSRLSYDLSSAFYEFQNKRESEILDTSYSAIEPFLNSQLRDYATSKKRVLSGELDTSSPEKTAGLTGKISRKRKHISKIKNIVLDEFETRLLKSSEFISIQDNKLDNSNTPMSDTILVEGISNIMQTKYGALQDKEWRKTKKGSITQDKMRSKFRKNVKSYQSDLESQIERGSKDLESSTASSFQTATWKAINISGKSSSQLIMKYAINPVVSSNQNFKGVLSSGQKPSKITKLEASFAKSLSSRFKTSATKRKGSQSEVTSDYQAVQVKKVLKNISVPSEITFSNSDIDHGFVIKIDAINSKGQIVDSKKKTINHIEKIKNFYSSSVSPTISAKFNDSGDLQVSVKQIDKDADSLCVYRKYISERSILDGEEFILINKFSGASASDESGEKEFIDTLDKIYGSKIMYRAVSYTSSGGGSGAFSDFILDISGLSNSSNKSSSDFLQGSIVCKVQEGGISLAIPEITGDRSAVFIEKRSQEDGYKLVERIFNSKDKQRSSRISSEYTMLDKDVNHGCTYRYNLVYITEHGTEKRLQPVNVDYRFIFESSDLSVSAQSSSQKNSPAIQSVKLKMNIGSILNLDKEEASQDALAEYSKAQVQKAATKESAIEIAQKIREESRDAKSSRAGLDDKSLLADFLKSRGKEMESSDKDFKNKAEESIYGIEVQRVDLKTGEVSDVGIFMPGETYEDTEGLKSGRSYEYIFQELKMPLSTYTEIVDKISVSESDKSFRSTRSLSIDKTGTDKSKDFEDNYRSKFLDKSSVVDGVVRSSLSRTLSPSTTLQKNRSGIVKSIKVTLPKSNSVVLNANTAIVSNKRVLISWSASSSKYIKNKSDIDFFLITAKKLGQIYPILKCHGQSIGGGSFLSIDDTQEDFLGEITYFITPIYNNATLGDTIKAGTVVMR